MSIHKVSINRPKSVADHKLLEDWNDEDSDSSGVFFVSCFDDEGGEEEVFGNDYFERNGIPVPSEDNRIPVPFESSGIPVPFEDNGIPVPDDQTGEDDDTRDAIDDHLDAEDGSDDLDWGEYHDRLEDEDAILYGSIDEANQDDSMGEEEDSVSDEDTKEDENDGERKRKDTQEDGNDDERKKTGSPVEPSINPFTGKIQKQKHPWRYMEQKHPWRHMEQIPFMKQCQLCGRMFSSKFLYMLHDPCYDLRLALKRREDGSVKINSGLNQDLSVKINSGSNQDLPYECLECDRKFQTRTFIGNHARSHYTPNFKCELCPFVTYWHSTASRHEESHLRNRVRGNRKKWHSNEADLKHDLKHVQVPPFEKVCDLCFKTFGTKPCINHSSSSEKRWQGKWDLNEFKNKSGMKDKSTGMKDKSTGMKDKSTEIDQGLVRWKYECPECHKGCNHSNGSKCHPHSHLKAQWESGILKAQCESGILKAQCESGILKAQWESGILKRESGILKKESGILKKESGILKRESGILKRESGIRPFISCYSVSGLRHGKRRLSNDGCEGEECDGKGEEEECDGKGGEEEECDGENEEDGSGEDGEKNVDPDLIQKCLESTEELKFTDPIPFHETCDHCGKGFRSKGRYITHSPCYIQKLAAKKIRVNSEKNNSTENNSSRIEYLDENFLYECTVCDRRFSRMKYLAQHAQTHFGPSFKCKICPHTSQFKQLAILHDGRHLSKYQVSGGIEDNGKETIVEKKSPFTVSRKRKGGGMEEKSPFTVSRKRKGGGMREKSSKRMKRDSKDDELSNDPFFFTDEDEE